MNFKILELELLMFDQNALIAKIVLLWGKNLIMGKEEVFGILTKLLLKDLLICQNKCFWLRDRKKNLFCENKPSGGKSNPKCQILCELIDLQFALVSVGDLFSNAMN
jgi:hypothetical protein